MIKRYFSSLGLTIETATIKFKKSEEKDATNFFHGSPVAYYLLKYSKHGDPAGCYGFGWTPLSIELCVNDVDDHYDCYCYKARNEYEFDKIVGAISEWMQEAEQKEHTLDSCLKRYDMPYRELFR